MKPPADFPEKSKPRKRNISKTPSAWRKEELEKSRVERGGEWHFNEPLICTKNTATGGGEPWG